MKAISKIFILAVCFAVIYLIYLTAHIFSSWVSSLYAGSSDSIKAASITAFVTVLIFVFGKYIEQSRERKARLSIEKIAVYKKFFDFYFDLFSYEKINGKPKDDSVVLRELLEFQKEIVFWGSDAVLKAYINFRNEAVGFSFKQGDTQSESAIANLARMFNAVAALLVAMRRDIGYTFTSFSASDLATLQLNQDTDNQKLIRSL